MLINYFFFNLFLKLEVLPIVLDTSFGFLFISLLLGYVYFLNQLR